MTGETRTDRRKAVWGAVVIIGVALLALTAAGCGRTLEGDASSYLIVDRLEAASGAEPELFSTVLHSDVVTIVDGQDAQGNEVRVPTVFSDPARVTLRLAMKDPGTAGSPVLPTPNNFITVNRYRVSFTRADGRNTPGVDVPHPWDGTVTFTVNTQVTTFPFLLVRHQTKEEAPLAALANGGGANLITTLADITFYGQDQTGRDVSVSTTMTVIFGNFGDPES
ncbi:MAG TPA: hypothetical protein VHJ77_19680 [Vicinamibacterales bacterium]|nr:hypothetical protein [Vicinamibacterales bacterium]